MIDTRIMIDHKDFCPLCGGRVFQTEKQGGISASGEIEVSVEWQCSICGAEFQAVIVNGEVMKWVTKNITGNVPVLGEKGINYGKHYFEVY